MSGSRARCHRPTDVTLRHGLGRVTRSTTDVSLRGSLQFKQLDRSQKRRPHQGRAACRVAPVCQAGNPGREVGALCPKGARLGPREDGNGIVL